jgi:hypothetical protein
MKQFKKWGLAGLLLLALASNLSFNPETKTIARNDGVHSGVYSLSSCGGTNEPACPSVTPPAVPPAPPAGAPAPVVINPNEMILNLGDYDAKYKGIQVKATLTPNKDNAGFIVNKIGEMDKTTEASFCALCIGTNTVAIPEVVRLNEDFVKRAIVAAAIKEIEAKKKKTVAEEEKEKDKISVSDITIGGERCSKPKARDVIDGLDGWEDYLECQKDRLSTFEDLCQDKVDEKIAEEKKLKGKKDIDEDKIEKRVKDQCKKKVKVDRFYTAEIKPFLEQGLGQQAKMRMMTDAFGRPITDGMGRLRFTAVPTTTHRAAYSMSAYLKGLPFDMLSTSTSNALDAQLRRGTAQSAISTYDYILGNAREAYATAGFTADKAEQFAKIDASTTVGSYITQLRAYEGQPYKRASALLSSSSGNTDYLNDFNRIYWGPTQTLAEAAINPNRRGNIYDLLQNYLNGTDAVLGGSTIIPSTTGTGTTGDTGRPRIQGLGVSPATTVVPAIQTGAGVTVTPGARTFQGPRLAQ